MLGVETIPINGYAACKSATHSYLLQNHVLVVIRSKFPSLIQHLQDNKLQYCKHSLYQNPFNLHCRLIPCNVTKAC